MWSIHSAVEDDVPPQTSLKSSKLRSLDVSRISKVNTTVVFSLTRQSRERLAESHIHLA